jgi:hypothetical protein
MGFCTNCGRQVREDMTYCPGCGADLSTNETEGARPRMGVPPPASPMPGPVPFPPVPFGFPMYYRPPASGRRIVSIVGGIILIIDACLAILLGLILAVDSWEFWSGVLMLAAGVFAIIAAIGVFLSFNPYLNVSGPIVLIFSAMIDWIIFSEAAIVFIIGISIAFVSLLLLAIGWSDSVERARARKTGLHPSMAGFHPAMGGAPPPAYGGAQPPSLLNVRK